MKRYVIMILMCLTTLACNDKLTELEVVEFGAALVDGTTVPFNYKAGQFDIQIVSDGEFEAEIVEGEDWLHFYESATTFSGNSDVKSLTVYYDTNRSILRKGKIVLTRKHRKVELEVSQIGILSEDFSIEHQNLWADAKGGELCAKVLTLSGADDIQISTEYMETGHKQWIVNPRIENNYLKFIVLENLSSTSRHALIALTKNGSSVGGKIQVGQPAFGIEYSSVTIDDIKDSLAVPGSIDLKAHSVLTGCIVLNDNLDGNGAENQNITSVVQDLTVADRTLYLSNADGSSGIRIEFTKGSELLTKRFDHVEIDLAGAVLTREENPDRYVISGIPATAVMKNEPGNAGDVTIKPKKMSELTDADVYTLVELTDCEIPIRKGPYIGIDVRNYDVMNKYPMVIRDNEGERMHMMVNTTCSWHRDGTAMPQGSGSIIGVIVHEHCDNFEWDQKIANDMVNSDIGLDYVTGIGEIGLYQIRPVTKGDIRLDQEFENGFSRLICEFAYYYADTLAQRLIPNYVDSVMYATAGEQIRAVDHKSAARLSLWKKTVSGDEDAAIVNRSRQHITDKRDWSLLGPYSDGKITDLSTGNGVYCSGQPAVWFKTATQESYGRTQARIDKSCGSAWNSSDWSAINKYWQLEFSTAGLSAADGPMSIQIGAINGYGDYVGGPHNWQMLYCTSEDDEGVVIAEYTVPDFPLNGNRRVWHCPGHKYMSFTVPEDVDIWGKDNVIIRMIPSNTDADTGNSYSGGKVSKLVEHSLNYVSVRCNKN